MNPHIEIEANMFQHFLNLQKPQNLFWDFETNIKICNCGIVLRCCSFRILWYILKCLKRSSFFIYCNILTFCKSGCSVLTQLSNYQTRTMIRRNFIFCESIRYQHYRSNDEENFETSRWPLASTQPRSPLWMESKNHLCRRRLALCICSLFMRVKRAFWYNTDIYMRNMSDIHGK